MYEIVAAGGGNQVEAADRGVVVAEDVISIDTEHFDFDREMDIDVFFNGGKAGRLHYYPPREKRDGALPIRKKGLWGAFMTDVRFANQVCMGSGETPDEAIEDALTAGIDDLRAAIASGVRLKNLLKKKSTHVSLKMREERA